MISYAQQTPVMEYYGNLENTFQNIQIKPSLLCHLIKSTWQEQFHMTLPKLY